MGTALALLGGRSPAQEEALSPIDDPESYAVYASLLADERTARLTTLVIREETATSWDCMPSGRPLEGDWRSVVEGYKSANAVVHTLLPGDRLRRPYILVPARETKTLFEDGFGDARLGWAAFYRRYPDSGGYSEVSAVGFDAGKTRALVYLGHHCGSLCGGGRHHLLEKVDGAWRVAEIPGLRQCSWAS